MERLSRKIQFKMSSKGLKTLLVTSSLENEGKSTVAANLALSLAEQGLKTAIVDLDLRKPIYRPLAAYGHMGREDLGVRWECRDRTEELLRAVAD